MEANPFTGTISDTNTNSTTSSSIDTTNMTNQTTNSNTTTTATDGSLTISSSSSSSFTTTASITPPPTTTSNSSFSNSSKSGDSKLPSTIPLEPEDKNSKLLPELDLSLVTTTTQSKSTPNDNNNSSSNNNSARNTLAESSQTTITKIQKVKHNSSSRPNPILISASERKARKRKPRVSWPNEEKLRSFHYFEYIQDERVNVMRLASETQQNAVNDTPPNASSTVATSSSPNKVPNKAAGVNSGVGGSSRNDSDKCHEYIRWRPLIPIDFVPELQSPGWNSTERTAQAERETYVLGAIDLPGQPSIIDEPDMPTKSNGNNTTTETTATITRDGNTHHIIEIPANNIEGTYTEHSNMYDDDNSRLLNNQIPQPMLQPFLQPHFQAQMQTQMQAQMQAQLQPQMQQPMMTYFYHPQLHCFRY